MFVLCEDKETTVNLDNVTALTILDGETALTRGLVAHVVGGAYVVAGGSTPTLRALLKEIAYYAGRPATASLTLDVSRMKAKILEKGSDRDSPLPPPLPPPVEDADGGRRGD